MVEALGTTHIDFLKYRFIYWLFSAALLIGGLATYIYKYRTEGSAFTYSVEYTGGTQALFSFSTPIHSEKVVALLEGEGFKGVVARDFSDREILVRVAEFENDSDGLAERMRSALQKKLPDTQIEIKAVDSVGANTGASLWLNSLYAIIIGLLLMLLYTGWRFWSPSYGIGVLVSLFHDAFVILAFFMLFNYEISANVVAAILAILGYSINDTIVIFSRIRDNLKKMPHASMDDIVNLSINETLRRTILTSVATALVVVSLLIFGGNALRSLSIALLIGIIFGTYSSIAIASPVMLLLYGEKQRSKR